MTALRAVVYFVIDEKSSPPRCLIELDGATDSTLTFTHISFL